MPLIEDLGSFFTDFGVDCTAGAITGKGILDMPSEVVAGGMVLSTDYTVTAKASDFGSLISGDSITVDSVAYTVREVRLIDDGKLCEIALQKT